MTTEIWATLRRAAAADDRASFERLIAAIVDEAVRDELATRAIASRAREEGPFCYRR